ncbi:hypothetical protein EPN96_11890 [bacterium]|nr:MAG: hypothetical protein EPN96_11890 [bacterium]
MKKIIQGGLALAMALSFIGCSGSGGGDGSVDSSITLTNSRQGSAGGFVDIDGDGDEDKIVGAPYAEAASKTGALLVYTREGEGYGTRPSMVLTGDDNFGFSFANVGDVDKDGIDDFAVCALNGSGDGASDPSLSGSVYVYRGGTGGELIKKLSGEYPLAKFGYAIAGGDLDGDGYSDVIAGAPFNTSDPALQSQGAVYLYFGPDLTRTISLYATSAVKGLGWSAASGDVNGDGTDDLLISASGKVLGFYGGPAFSPSLSAPDVTVTSAATGFGRTLAVLGDIDGDGFGEFAIGAPKAVVNDGKETGCLYVIKGGTGTRTIDLSTNPSDLLAKICGAGPFDRFGFAIALAGDIDEDGKPDFAVSAPLCNCAGKPMGGKVYFFKGKDVNSASTLSSATSFDAMIEGQGYGVCLAANAEGNIMIGGPLSNGNTGGVSMIDPATGAPVTGGSSGGDTGGSGSCH